MSHLYFFKRPSYMLFIFAAMSLTFFSVPQTAFSQTQEPIPQDDTRYLSVLPTIPLMAGLFEIEGSALLFDKADGQIVSVEAQSPSLNREEILTYYHDVLPQLGWQKNGKASFSREDELLHLSFDVLAKTPNHPIKLRFDLEPK